MMYIGTVTYGPVRHIICGSTSKDKILDRIEQIISENVDAGFFTIERNWDNDKKRKYVKFEDGCEAIYHIQEVEEL